MINNPQLGYCVRIELYTRTVSSEWARFCPVFIGNYRENYENLCNKGIGQYFTNTLQTEQDILFHVFMFRNNLEMFLNNFFHLNISALKQNSKNPPHNLYIVVQKHALSERLKLVCAAQICGEVLLKIYFRAEISRCKKSNCL